MPACHAGGHEFESRTHRTSPLPKRSGLVVSENSCFVIIDYEKNGVDGRSRHDGYNEYECPNSR